MKTINVWKTHLNDKLVSETRHLEFLNRVGILEVSVKQIQKGAGSGMWSFKARSLSGIEFQTEDGKFCSNPEQAFNQAIDKGISLLEEVSTTLSLPAKTAEKMKFVTIFPIR